MRKSFAALDGRLWEAYFPTNLVVEAQGHGICYSAGRVQQDELKVTVVPAFGHVMK
jgi:hypothetical protein